ncbi:MAG: DUF896 domain-containing protein [Clostridia bacterium]|nr:DUF896 domain-containing protein [Clostridia bacterium]
MERANIERINALTQISSERELTPEEQKEREERRAAYLKAFRAQMRGQLENTVVEYPDGSRVSLREAAQKK